MLTGVNLFKAVRSSDAPASFWWLGQHTFILRLGGRVVLIDPFLTEMDERNVPPLFEPENAAGVVDVVACTHDHLDHIDPAAIPGLAERTGARFIAPRAHEERMRSLGVPSDRLDLIDDEEQVDVLDLTFHGIKGAHEFFDRTEEGHYPFLGYVIEGGGKTAYHAGDTLWWEGLQARLRPFSMDVAFVPINGRDARRFRDDILGNMTYQEAADLVGDLEVELIVPAHFDMFDANLEDPQLFVDYMAAKYPGRRVWVGDYTKEVPF